ncbi:hypothetical protein [Streptomyces nodosus]|uniref:hypothetical protein n=1 Tax=Streptomyces nodosus TaxID=40318 RepID=UPI00380675FD
MEIPYEDAVLHGYFYRAAGEGPKPTPVMHNGFDGAAEEPHFFGAVGGQERDCHALTFDGPGQPAAIHRNGLVFRPDRPQARPGSGARALVVGTVLLPS